MQVNGRVMFINQPKTGQRYGSIKIDHPTIQRISMQAHDLAKFSQGQSYTIEVKQTEQGYFNFVEIVSAMKAPAQSPQRTGISPAAQSYARGTDSHDYNTGKQICITGITQRAIQSGKFEVRDIPAIMRLTGETYDEIFRGKPQQLSPSQRDRQYNGRTGSEPAGPRYDVPSVGDDLNDDPFPDDNNPPF